MKWDLFVDTVKREGRLCASAQEPNILKVPFGTPGGVPSHSLVDPPAQQYSIKQPWLQHRANSLPPTNPKMNLNLSGSNLKVFTDSETGIDVKYFGYAFWEGKCCGSLTLE